MMKKWIVVLGLLIGILSCSKDTEDKLYGKWQLRQVVAADGQTQTVDTVWYNFQTSLFMYLIAFPSEGPEVYRNAYGFSTPQGDDQLLLQLQDPQPIANFLRYTDWTSAERTFTIEKLTGSELILNSSEQRYIFHKY